jgi:spore germination protein KC
MKRGAKLCYILLLLILIMTGCWNHREPDKLAFVTGNGLDITKDGKLEASALVVTPSGIGGGQISAGQGEDSFHVISATGSNVSDALVNIQSKISRALFSGHRDVFLVGQRLAENGIGETIDPFLRYTQSDLRSLIYVVKNGRPKDVFSTKPFFDPFITTTLFDEQVAIGLKPYLAREFVVDVLSEGLQPLLPVVSKSSSKQYSYTGSAILNKEDKVKLVGYLNKKDTSYVRWITDRLSYLTLTSFVPKEGGNVSLQLESIGRRIRVKQVDDQIRINIHLTGKGTIIENNTRLDPSMQKDLQRIETVLSQNTQKNIKQLIKKVQKEYKLDIFGFGAKVHQRYPKQWKSIKGNWDETFSNLEITVKVDLQCNDPGQTNSSLKTP